MSSPEDGLEKQSGRLVRMEQEAHRPPLCESLEEVRATIARAQVDESLQDIFLNSLNSVETHLGEIEANDIERAPNGESVIVLAALVFLAAEHGGRKTVVRVKDAFAKYFPKVEYDVWLGVQKAANN